MTTTKTIAAAFLLLLYSCTNQQKDGSANAAKEPVFQVVVTHKSFTDAAWGYVIEANHKRFIQQFTIPALEGNQLFANQQQAALVGNLVALKLNAGKHPTISKKELDSLGIIQPTHATYKK